MEEYGNYQQIIPDTPLSGASVHCLRLILLVLVIRYFTTSADSENSADSAQPVFLCTSLFTYTIYGNRKANTDQSELMS